MQLISRSLACSISCLYFVDLACGSEHLIMLVVILIFYVIMACLFRTEIRWDALVCFPILFHCTLEGSVWVSNTLETCSWDRGLVLWKSAHSVQRVHKVQKVQPQFSDVCIKDNNEYAKYEWISQSIKQMDSCSSFYKSGIMPQLVSIVSIVSNTSNIS